MSQSKSKQNTTVEVIAPADVWETITDGVNTIAHGEGVFVFDPDEGFECVTRDGANVALIAQRVDPGNFDSYNVDGEFSIGVNTEKFEDVLGKVDSTVPVELSYDWDTYNLRIRAGEVEYNMAGIQPEQVVGSPAEIPPPKEKFPYDVDVNIPVDKFKRATGLVEMASQIATFRMGGDKGVFVFAAEGDTDDVTIKAHEGDGFEWNEDPPSGIVETRQSNKYLSEIVGLLDEDTFRVVTGKELPYHLWTTRCDVVDTKILQAPRIDTSK